MAQLSWQLNAVHCFPAHFLKSSKVWSYWHQGSESAHAGVRSGLNPFTKLRVHTGTSLEKEASGWLRKGRWTKVGDRAGEPPLLQQWWRTGLTLSDQPELRPAYSTAVWKDACETTWHEAPISFCLQKALV